MAPASFPFLRLPVELQDIILSFLDYPSMINIITVSKFMHELAIEHPLLRDPEIKTQFLLYKEAEQENLHPWPWAFSSDPFTLTSVIDNPYKFSIICFYCRKLKPITKFNWKHVLNRQPEGDFGRTGDRRRFCFECGVKDLEARDMGAGIWVPGGRKFYPGHVACIWRTGSVHLCGGCGEWCGEWRDDLHCMKEKLRFRCAKENWEKFVEGYQERPLSAK